LQRLSQQPKEAMRLLLAKHDRVSFHLLQRR
jgi:hypothetical protein